jgi:cold shock CspA family protein
MAMENPIEHGVIKNFCRVKGHGFIKKDDGEDIFVHVSEYDFFPHKF